MACRAPLAGDELTRSGLARLVAGHIYEGSVVHDLAGTTLWDYQPWADRNPPRMYTDGRRIPVDVYQRMIDNNFALQIKRASLLTDYGSVALDDTGRELFARFAAECAELQDVYDRTPAGPWRMEPKNLEIAMNA
jgi:arachidonate 15-lipoxygenase